MSASNSPSPISALGPTALAFLGGIRSGKSAIAQRRFMDECSQKGLKSPVYLGTLLLEAADADRELADRLTAHRESRPAHWATVDVGADLLGAAQKCLEAGHDAWFLDGLGAWAALQLNQPQAAMAALGGFMALARKAPLCVLVLDEVGQGGVPGDFAARAFADLNGALNQAACGDCAEVWGVQAGLALRWK
jgi:adenosylcobinamide kinase/adenosylcobinamide-phosphate guanylyltransferase